MVNGFEGDPCVIVLPDDAHYNNFSVVLLQPFHNFNIVLL
jgi:hypothetical protein